MGLPTSEVTPRMVDAQGPPSSGLTSPGEPWGSEALCVAGDPRTATRGRPGASAVALGRRIIANANAEMQRYGSACLSGTAPW